MKKNLLLLVFSILLYSSAFAQIEYNNTMSIIINNLGYDVNILINDNEKYTIKKDDRLKFDFKIHSIQNIKVFKEKILVFQNNWLITDYTNMLTLYLTDKPNKSYNLTDN